MRARHAANQFLAVAIGAWSGEGFNGAAGDHLVLHAGSRIEVTQRGEAGGWWYGRLDGKRGWFPSALVQPAEERPLANISTSHTTMAEMADIEGRLEPQQRNARLESANALHQLDFISERMAAATAQQRAAEEQLEKLPPAALQGQPAGVLQAGPSHPGATGSHCRQDRSTIYI